MASRTQFAPGRNSSCQKLIHFVGSSNANPNSKPCIYINPEIIDKSTIKPNISTAQRIAHLINVSTSGNIQFGNYYLGKPVVFNYLGRTEGQIGGSGFPLRNHF
jgi:hypothetical protein